MHFHSNIPSDNLKIVTRPRDFFPYFVGTENTWKYFSLIRESWKSAHVTLDKQKKIVSSSYSHLCVTFHVKTQLRGHFMIRENCCFYQPKYQLGLNSCCWTDPVGNERRLHSDNLHSLIMCLLLPVTLSCSLSALFGYFIWFLRLHKGHWTRWELKWFRSRQWGQKLYSTEAEEGRILGTDCRTAIFLL